MIQNANRKKPAPNYVVQNVSSHFGHDDSLSEQTQSTRFLIGHFQNYK